MCDAVLRVKRANLKASYDFAGVARKPEGTLCYQIVESVLKISMNNFRPELVSVYRYTASNLCVQNTVLPMDFEVFY